MIFGEAGSGSVPDTIAEEDDDPEAVVEAAGGVLVTAALAKPEGRAKTASKRTKATFLSFEFSISLSPLQRDVRWAETRNSHDQIR